jgi:hypothetical protein
VGLAAQAAEVLARALREGVAPRTRQNPRGLPMDEPLRRARAESLGFDLGDVRYHGTSADADFRSFRQKDRGVWTTDDPREASGYAQSNDSQGYRDGRPMNTAPRVIPLVSRAESPHRITAEEEDAIRLAPGFSGYQRAQAQAFRRARAAGHDQIDLGGGVRADLDVRNLRSPHATFDPERSREADLLAGVGGGAAGALAAFEGLVGREEAEAPRYADGGRVEREPGWLEGLAASAGPAAIGLIGSVVRRRPTVQRGLPSTDGFWPVFPQPQRMMPEGERIPGGRYLEAPRRDPATGQMVGEDITGQVRGSARIEVGPDGRPVMLASPEMADPVEAGHRVRTNLFRRSAGWDWVGEPPAGAADHPFLVSVETGNRHHYALGTDFEGPVTMARYPRATSEPRLRPTTRGDVELGEQVGTISVRGTEHPVYDRVYVVRPGDEVEPVPRYAAGGLADAGSYADGGRVMPGGGTRALLAERLAALGPQAIDGLRRFLAERPIGIGVRSARTAQSVLEDGRIRTQFETGTSSGHYGPDYRAQVESQLFGLPSDLPVEQRPVYGALRAADNSEHEWGGDPAPWAKPDNYGQRVFLLRPEVKNRSTYTLDDSLGLAFYAGREGAAGRARGFRFDDVPDPDALLHAGDVSSMSEWALGDLESRLARAGTMMGQSPSGFSLAAARSPYIETQTRGPVSMDDVAGLIVPRLDVPRLRDAAGDRRVPLYTMDQIGSDAALQRRLGLRAAGAGLGLGALIDGEDEPARYAAGGLAGATMHGAGAAMHGNAPGPADELAATQGAAVRGLQQAQRMWDMAGGLVGG